jgi:hypothetical protein
MAPYSLLDWYQRFVWSCRLHLQGKIRKWAVKRWNASTKLHEGATSKTAVLCQVFSFTSTSQLTEYFVLSN